MIEGTYPDNFLPALLYEVAADGTVTDRPITLLGADARETGDTQSAPASTLTATADNQPARPSAIPSA